MNCDQAQTALSEWRDGELFGTEQRLLEQHLTNCFICRTYQHRLQVMGMSIHRECSVTAPDTLECAIAAQIVHQKNQRQSIILVRLVVGGVASLLGMMVLALFLRVATEIFSVMGVCARLFGHTLSLAITAIWAGGSSVIVWTALFCLLFVIGYLAIRQLSHHSPIHD